MITKLLKQTQKLFKADSEMWVLLFTFCSIMYVFIQLFLTSGDFFFIRSHCDTDMLI